MDHSYWYKQTADKPLYPDIEWAKPEQRGARGNLGIIGGNKLGFAGVAEAYSEASTTGAGAVRVLLPDAIKKSIPPIMTDVIFAPTNPSGGLAGSALTEMLAIGEWSSVTLLIGDAGRNSETAILYEDFINKYSGPLVLTRDAVDLVKNASASVVERPDTLLVVSFAQFQKLFQSVYYPKVLTFSMQLSSLVEAVHKFTISYPVSIAVLHADVLVVSHGGEVTTTPWDNPMLIWRGITATRAATYLMWHRTKPLQAVTASLIGGE